MAVYFHLFNQESQYQGKRINDYEEPWVSLTEEAERVDYNKTYDEKLSVTPLTFRILSDGEVGWVWFQGDEKSIEYSKNGGAWTTITSKQGNPEVISVVSGDVLVFKGNTWPGYGSKAHFSSTCKFNVEGNPLSLKYGENFTGNEEIESYCFQELFYSCRNLIEADKLKLTTRNLKDYCYFRMFAFCESLTTAPELPATTLTEGCYQYMFQNCTSLTTAPELPATTLTKYCYGYMFYGCTSLDYIKCLATNISASNCTANWVSSVASTGTFVKAASADWSSKTGTNGIPANWTVQDA